MLTHESEDIVSKWVDNLVDNELDSSIVTDAQDWYERWAITGYDDEYLEEDENPEYGDCQPPTWLTWFEVNSYASDWIEKNQYDVAKLGFKIIWRTDDCGAYVFGIGLDYTGCGFIHYQWADLYEFYQTLEMRNDRYELVA